jgi:hypothetical protein
VQPLDLLDTAEFLLLANNGTPSQANIRRAYSSIYYALFHTLCQECADRIVGSTPNCRSQRAWEQVYRALDHGPAKKQCKKITNENHLLNFPAAIKDFAALLCTLQQKRHSADYAIRDQFSETDALTQMEIARIAIRKFLKAPIKHRKALAAYLLINQRAKPD